jgi:2-alkyl-3-oxoalkanoate reductase
LLAGEVPVRWMTEGRGASNAKAKHDLGWQPTWRSWRVGFRDGITESAKHHHAAPTQGVRAS